MSLDSDFILQYIQNTENPYDISPELKIRKILEYSFDYTYEFRKNDNRYGYDIICYKYFIHDDGGFEKLPVVFIETEVSYNIDWISDLQENWKWYSFLARKVLKFNSDNDCFTDELKENADKCVYLKFNRYFKDCFCCDMNTISKFDKIYWPGYTNENDGYNHAFLRTSLDDKRVIRGIPESMEFIKNFIRNATKPL